MNFNKTVGNVGISLNTYRLDRNIREAQKKLNMQVVADCEPLIPFQQGGLLGSQRYPEGIYGGEIAWDTPYAHYQYEGLLRTDEQGRVYVGKGESKPILTDIPLQHHSIGTTAHWFEKAKGQNLEQWVDIVKRTAGKD